MAYVPPHKRHSRGGAGGPSSSPSPTTPLETVNSNFKRKRNFNSKAIADKGVGKSIVYAENARSKWFAVGLADDTLLPIMTRLEPVSLESYERKSGEKPLTLVLCDHHLKENCEDRRVFLAIPWAFVAGTVKQDLLWSFQQVRENMECCEFEDVKPTLVARFGKILFHGNRSFSLESISGKSVPESTLKQLKKSFYTNVPPSYVEYITNEVVPKIGFDLEGERELYHVKLSDKMRPDSTLSCKCTVTKDSKKLELCKVELNQVRHMVADISCLDKNLDLRLMLRTKRTLIALKDEEIENIKSLIGSANLDSEVKGGLRWPLGKQSSGDQYTVVGVWHTNGKTFRNSSMRLKVRHADRFDFRSSAGEVSREVILKMPGIIPQLHEQTDLAMEMLKENLKLIWTYFLCYDSVT
ncbi:hypothetical protein Adt_00693 [Abeliophyllum distichum]|uniref:DUF7903 domain-containing protein n=1 Tax=Abeliophyllum distichum TaxID=126358 RepID=A0ABD1VQS7_9LAMI